MRSPGWSKIMTESEELYYLHKINAFCVVELDCSSLSTWSPRSCPVKVSTTGFLTDVHFSSLVVVEFLSSKQVFLDLFLLSHCLEVSVAIRSVVGWSHPLGLSVSWMQDIPIFHNCISSLARRNVPIEIYIWHLDTQVDRSGDLVPAQDASMKVDAENDEYKDCELVLEVMMKSAQ